MKTKVLLLMLLTTVICGQTDTTKSLWSENRIVYHIPKPDTTEATLFVVEEAYLVKPYLQDLDMRLKKVVTLVDGYVVRDYWRVAEPIYLDENKKPIKALYSVARIKQKEVQ